ncbi:nitroreductase family protein [Planococcus lenghuensis]|uniref:Nitroreductase family protein n=1 Tax=Planococcus lenghuensis TaxID=2213202 RepID=A0A1Q2KZF8_9BACL|nr:nitroreductase family protein [Planococcus lenghuensis]AQQ53585.1 nitroreductase family protein [Planococcus lenghuensis]
MTVQTDSRLYEIMKARKSVRLYDPSVEIPKEEIEELLTMAVSAPSSSNLQSWRFLVIQDQDIKKEVRGIANNQAQVEDASAVIAILGDVDAYKKVEQIYTQNVEEGHMDESIKERTVSGTNKFYPAMTKETRMNIASFDAGLVSMQLMLLAKERGYDTITMGGFSKEQFAARFELPENLFPIVLIAIGQAAAPAFGTSRLPLEETTTFI